MTVPAIAFICLAFIVLMVSVLRAGPSDLRMTDDDFKDFEKSLHIKHLETLNKPKGGKS